MLSYKNELYTCIKMHDEIDFGTNNHCWFRLVVLHRNFQPFNFPTANEDEKMELKR